MICAIGNRPALLIGPHHQVFGYDTDWIAEALQRAAISAGRDDFPFVQDICHGIIYYLENKCPLNLLPIEDLYVRISRMLERIGCEAIARELTVLSPPVTISLREILGNVDFAFELGFFQELRTELLELQCYGAERIRVTDIRETVLLLRQSKRWTRKCDALAADIIAYIKKYQSVHRVTNRSISLSFEAVTHSISKP